MAEDTNSSKTANVEPGVVTLIIPEHLAQQVVEFVGTLEADADDVRGHMLNLGLNLGRLAETTQTVTNCRDTNGGKDTLCDNDTWITH